MKASVQDKSQTSELLGELATNCAPRLMPLTTEQLHEMVRTGIVPESSPVELIDGVLIYKDRGGTEEDSMVHDPRHASAVTCLLELLMPWAKGIDCHVRVQLPVTLTSVNEPEPDLALIRGTSAEFSGHHPQPKHIAAVFEVSDSSLRFDRTTKQRLYSSAGIPVYWILNLAEDQVEVYTGPDAARGCFSDHRVYRSGESVSLVIDAHVLETDVAPLLA